MQTSYSIPNDLGISSCDLSGAISVLPCSPEMPSRSLYQKFEGAWGYCDKSMGVTKHTLNATIRYRIEDVRLTKYVTRLKLFSAIGIVVNCFSMRSTAQKVSASFHMRDYEGFGLSVLGLALLVGDSVDLLATFLNATVLTFSKIPGTFFATITTPLSFGLIIGGSFTRTIKIIKTHTLKSTLQREVLSKRHGDMIHEESLRTFLTKRLRVTDAEKAKMISGGRAPSPVADIAVERERELAAFLACKKSILKRCSSEKVVEELEKLTVLLESGGLTEEQAREALKTLDRVVALLNKEMIADTGNLVANVISLIGLGLLSLAAGPASLPFIFLAVSSALKLSLLAYQDLATT